MKNDHDKLAGLADKQLGEVDARFMHRMTLEDEAMQEELHTQQDVSQWLRNSARPYHTDASPEFFWSQVSRGIDTAEAAQNAFGSRGKILSVLRMIWAPSAAVIIVLTLFFLKSEKSASFPYAHVIEAKTSLNRVSVTPFQSKESEATIIWIEGLDYLPANSNILPEATGS